ncbi:lipocalin-like domain-containing protein [Aureibaculum luteum]|uniref:lipocalin-like domain-containing protein n=1 Tax=Aureibaculum luteum TaxID=1548456 RepID=UPI000E510148|nr:lipocalin-like domain-containing protein [Aureibaculum luteum]
MSVHFVPKDYENTHLMFPSTIDSISMESLQYLAVSYTYFATYSIDMDKQIIEHKRISHSNPTMWNKTVKRNFSFAGDTLTLEPFEKEFAGTRLRWIKVSHLNE